MDLTAPIRAAVDTVSPDASAKNIDVQCTFPSPGPRIRGDFTRLQQVFWNLLNNAVKFCPPASKIAVHMDRDGEGWSIAVRDSGPGLDSTFAANVFERFWQADSSAARRFGGLGLGLAIVKQLVELHGGTVRAESEGKGRGATFVVWLPQVRAQQSQPPEPAQGVSDEIDFAGFRILFVDDDPDTRAVVARILRECSATVEVVSDADEALRQMPSFRPHLMISDIGLPDKDGYQLVRELRQSDAFRSLPTIALTAYARTDDRTRVLASGYDAYLTKPVNPRELLGKVSSLLARSSPPR
jgi:CheY-like chemotaxis protein